MFELTLSIAASKQKYLHGLYKKLNQEIKQVGGVIAKHNDCGRSYLAIAVPKKLKEFYKSKVLDHIVFIVVDDYKYNYYKENLLFSDENILQQSFLKAISIFDYDYDKDMVLKNIDLSSELNIDSFFFFKLQELKEKWQKTAFVLMQNNVLSNTQQVIEILRYLSAVSDSRVIKLDIFAGKSKIQIKTATNKKLFNNNEIGYSDFLTEVTELNPQKINVKVSRQNFGFDKTLEILRQVYGDKIYLQS